MTTNQMIAIGAIGGLVVLVGQFVFICLAVGAYLAATKVSDALADRRDLREFRRELDQCQASDAGTNPKDSS
ncbi:hypothetical protein [Streptomyces sp. NPDC094468]|uniref:hypothetical protein n=1 Tax=Streptomyces sp. NPDC094468 TaxID=3366066 RepID=UPI00381FF72E